MPVRLQVRKKDSLNHNAREFVSSQPISEWFLREMADRDMGIEEMAREIGVSDSMLGKWIRMTRIAVQRDTIEDILWRYDCIHLDDLISPADIVRHPKFLRCVG